MYWVVSVTLQRKTPCAADRDGDKAPKTRSAYILQAAQSYGRVVSNPVTLSCGRMEIGPWEHDRMIDRAFLILLHLNILMYDLPFRSYSPKCAKSGKKQIYILVAYG